MKRARSVRKAIWALAAVLVLGGIGWAETGTISGKVRDKDTGEPLPGASVIVEGTKLRTVTEDDGSYRIEGIPAGTYSVTAKMVGYMPLTTKVTIGTGESAVLDFDMVSVAIWMKGIVVTATRTESPVEDVPASTILIAEEDATRVSAMDVDDVLRMYPGIDVERPNGFLGRGRVSLRGVGNEPGRTLILVDGAPMNKADTGSFNWNRVPLCDVQRIEIIKGPVSALYGSNAMGGVINIITKKPSEGFSAELRPLYGSLNTLGCDLVLLGKRDRLGLKLSASYLASDGYISEPPEERDEYTIKRDLKQSTVSCRMSYDLSESSTVSVGYSRFDDHRGEGKRYRHEEGVYRRWDTDAFDLEYRTRGKFPLEFKTKLYCNVEHYYWNRERMRKGKYTWYEVTVPRVDGGAMIQASFDTDFGGAEGVLTSGLDYRYGSVHGEDAYRIKKDRPSDLKITNRGKQQTVSFFVQECLKTSRMNILLGGRYDLIRSYDGKFEDPSGFLPSEKYGEKRWKGFTPRLGLVYLPREGTRLWASVGSAFRAPILDDLYRNGIFRGRIYKANPELEPETITSAEVGVEHRIGKAFKVRLSAYYSVGRNYFYPVKVGKDPDTGRDLYQRQNIGKVKIYGLEPELSYSPTEGLRCFANATLNSSKIAEFRPRPELEGKYLEYTPKFKANVGILYADPKLFAVGLIWRYVGKVYVDPENTGKIDPYYVVDLKLSRQIGRYGEVSVSVKNLLDREYLEREDSLDPGRLVTFSVKLKY